MASPFSIKVDKLARLIGTTNAPVIIDVRTTEDFDDDPRIIPASIRRSHKISPIGRRTLRANPSSPFATMAPSSAKAQPHGSGIMALMP
jgi:hypothetical protein